MGAPSRTCRGTLRGFAVAGVVGFPAVAGSCSAAAPAPTPVVVVVPVASASAEPAGSDEPPAKICPAQMVFLAGGDLRGGARVRHVADLCMDATEVTAAAYGLCVEHGGCDDLDLRCDDAPTYGKAELLDHPINCVSWKQADQFCRAAGKRLPTFDEWEWAATARGDARRFAWGNTEPVREQICWSRGATRTGTCAVGTFPGGRTPEGVDDLFGGVWEWLAPAERKGVPNVARGGSWQNDMLSMLEGENAGSFVQGFVRNDVVGFRCVSGEGAARASLDEDDATGAGP